MKSAEIEECGEKLFNLCNRKRFGEAYSRIMTICLCLTYLFVSKKLILELFSKFYVSQLQCYFTPLVFQNADYLNLIVLVLIT